MFEKGSVDGFSCGRHAVAVAQEHLDEERYVLGRRAVGYGAVSDQGGGLACWSDLVVEVVPSGVRLAERIEG